MANADIPKMTAPNRKAIPERARVPTRRAASDVEEPLARALQVLLGHELSVVPICELCIIVTATTMS